VAVRIIDCGGDTTTIYRRLLRSHIQPAEEDGTSAYLHSALIGIDIPPGARKPAPINEAVGRFPAPTILPGRIASVIYVAGTHVSYSDERIRAIGMPAAGEELGRRWYYQSGG
jgi:hypothetical protein